MAGTLRPGAPLGVGIRSHPVGPPALYATEVETTAADPEPLAADTVATCPSGADAPAVEVNIMVWGEMANTGACPNAECASPIQTMKPVKLALVNDLSAVKVISPMQKAKFFPSNPLL
jgi:hypothetical protein